MKKPDIEKILSVNPDFVIASSATDSQIELYETLEKAGITVAYLDVSSFEDYLDMLNILTKITGRRDLYQQYGIDVEKQIKEAKAKIDGSRPSVLFIRAAASSVKAKGSEGTVGGEILADLDTVNIADSGSLLEDLSLEAIVMANPDYIFVTTQGSDTKAAYANVEKLFDNFLEEDISAVLSDKTINIFPHRKKFKSTFFVAKISIRDSHPSIIYVKRFQRFF